MLFVAYELCCIRVACCLFSVLPWKFVSLVCAETKNARYEEYMLDLKNGISENKETANGICKHFTLILPRKIIEVLHQKKKFLSAPYIIPTTNSKIIFYIKI